MLQFVVAGPCSSSSNSRRLSVPALLVTKSSSYGGIRLVRRLALPAAKHGALCMAVGLLRLVLGVLGCVRLIWVPRFIALLQICAEMPWPRPAPLARDASSSSPQGPP
uniref:Uncharacterized protein n=1 Tax=Kalanchoe fedtschenkoi TaxID=63787 RepID=A0A7N0TNA4_KALFE